MLVDTLQAVKDYLIANVDDLTTTNCVIEDTTVFNDILVLDPPVIHCVVISESGGMEPRNQTSEFGAFLIRWNVIVGVFYLLWGNDKERGEIIMMEKAETDKIIRAIVDDTTLGGEVMDAMVIDVAAPLMYHRNDNNKYVMRSITIGVKENM